MTKEQAQQRIRDWVYIYMRNLCHNRQTMSKEAEKWPGYIAWLDQQIAAIQEAMEVVYSKDIWRN
jgi:hypothetical protein